MAQQLRQLRSITGLNPSTLERLGVRLLPIYMAALAGMSVGVVGVSAFQLPRIPHTAEWLLFAALALLARRFALQITGIKTRLSVSDMFFVSSGLLFGPAPATVTIAMESLVMSYGRGHPLHRVLFDASAPAIAFWAGCKVFFYMLGAGPLFDSSVPPVRVVLPLAALAAVYYLLNSGFTAVVGGLEKRTSQSAEAAGPEALMALANLARIIQDGPTPADVGSVAWSQIRHVVPGATCGFFMIDPRTDSVVVRFVAGPSSQVLQGLHMKVGERLTGWVAENAQPIINADAALDLGHGAALANVGCCLSVPLMHRDQLVGVLSLYAATPFGDDQAQTIQLVAASLGQMFAAVAVPTPIKATRPTLVRFSA